MDRDSIDVMTFNLRNSRAADGANAWPLRRELAIEGIRAAGPDLLGTQEGYFEQVEDLRQSLGDEYELIGAGRNDGKSAGEFCAILYRRERFGLLESGTFWLSPNPDHIGEKGWDAGLPRIVTFARLRDEQNDRRILWLNTHFDDRGEVARLESARLIKRWVDQRADGDGVIVTGDFNADIDSPPYRALVSFGENSSRLVDACRASLGGSSDQDRSTFHGFTGRGSGIQIDWILCSREFTPRRASINRFRRADRYPSDHFPVTAALGWT